MIDTNVAAVASGANAGAGERCRVASAVAIESVMESGHLFIDDADEIIAEYIQVLTEGQPQPGHAFVKWLFKNQYVADRVTRVKITPSRGGASEFLELPAPGGGVLYDRSDQKFLAVAAAHAEHPPILQSFDSKWWGWREEIAKIGVSIHFLCPKEIKAKYDQKCGD